MLECALTFEDIASILDDIVDNDFPREYYRGLNGGIYLVPEEKHNPKIPSKHYFVLGEYRRSPIYGRSIYVFYGSFVQLYRHVSKTQARVLLKRVIAHELQHHLEGLAGECDLEIEDERYVQHALQILHQEGG